MGKARILAVDDQRYFRELIEGLLDDEGYDVQTASSGEEALHILEIALAGDPSDRVALEIRRAALQALLEEAEATFQNSYEMDWLKYRIRITDEALGITS